MNAKSVIDNDGGSQRELFEVFQEFFERATGKRRLQEFATFDSFDGVVHENAEELTRRFPEALKFAWDRLPKLYDPSDLRAFDDAQRAVGLKLVLGGSSRFGETHLDSVRKMLLYADTILIPDPVLPWMESPRSEERFRFVLLLQTIFTVLHLKPLVDADLPYPAVVVFPSFEKSLEEKDPITRAGIDDFSTQIFAEKLNIGFGSLAEVAGFATTNPADFLQKVEAERVFVGPQIDPSLPLREHIREYREHIQNWRSTEEQAKAAAFSDAQLVFQGIVERLGPQYHLLENAEETSANPMICIPNQWHYYTVCTTSFESRLKKLGLLEPKTIASVRAINQPELDWLGNIPIEDLVRLRSENENEAFRKRLSALTSQLSEASIEDLDRVTRETSKDLSSLLSEHSKGVRAQVEEFQTKYKIAAVGACVTLAAILLPALAPFGLSTSAAAVGLGYAATKIDELAKKKQRARSLVGVLAAAKNS